MCNNARIALRSTSSRSCWPVIFAMLACLGMAFDAAASDTLVVKDTAVLDDSLPVYRLGEVAVVRGRSYKPISQAIEITAPAMKAQGTTTVTGALSTTPGVVVTAGSKGESRVQIRGFQSQEMLILVDGRPVALPYYGDLDLNTLPISNISKISVVKGPAPTLFGANSMGGVINILSQRVVGSPVREARFSISGNGGSDVVVNYGAAARKLDWWLSAGRSESDGYDLSSDFKSGTLEDGDLRYNSDYRHTNLDGKLNYTVSDKTLVSFSAGVYDGVRGLPTGTDKGVYQRYPYWRRWYTDIGADGQLTSKSEWKVKFYYDDCENRLIRFRDSAMTLPNLVFDSYHDSYDLGGALGLRFNLSERLNNAVSIGLRRDGIRRQENTGIPWVENHLTTFSASDQIELNPTSKLRTELGAGYHRMQSNSDRATTEAVDIYGGATYALRTWLSVQFTASRATRFPTLNQLYSTTSGNADLEPESAVKIETGYSLRPTERLTFNQAYFRSDVSQLIDRKDKNSPYGNIDDVDLSGLESSVEYGDRRASVMINHTYLDAYEFNFDGTTSIKDRRSYSPRHKIDYALTLKFGFGLNLGHSGQMIVDRIGSDKKEMPDYYLANIIARYRINASVGVFANVRNLFDKNYEEELYYPMPGRLIAIGIEARL